MLDWNDLRYFLAVAEEGSTLAAGKLLRVSQTTVARRIATLEEALGLALFERRQSGYGLTRLGEAVRDSARNVAAAAGDFETTAASFSRGASGTIRLTTEEIYANTILVPILRELGERHPDIRILLDTTLEVRDLGSGEADIALRSMAGDAAPGLVGRRLCTDDWTFYSSRDYAAAHGVPRTPDEMHSHPLIGGGGGSLWLAYEAWLKEYGLQGNVGIQHASSTGVFTSVRAGSGLAVLPTLVAEGDPEFVRCLPPRRNNDRSIWLLTHERLRQAPHIRTVIDFLYERLKNRVRTLNLAA